MTNFEDYKKLLNKFVSFKSISTDKKFLPEINKTATWLLELFKNAKFEVKKIESKNSNPVVFAKYIVDKKSKTLLIYGHYDVQPASKEDGWKGEPFELSSSKTKLFARGVVDNKGQILTHIFTALELIKSKNLKYNLIFLIEGNEETSNPDLPGIIRKYKKQFKCDTVIVSDGELTNNKPTIEVSLRGGFNAKLTYRTGKNNLHSGIFGGAVPNASLELSKFLNKLFKADGSISFPEFYKGADKITEAEKINNKRLSKEAVDIKENAGTYKLLISKGEDFYTKTGLIPTLQITGFKSGYIDSGFANIVPATAEVRLNFRIVTSQKPELVKKSFEKFVKENTPSFIKYELDFAGLHNPIKVNTKSEFVNETEKLLQKVYKSKVNRKNVGGAIPFVADCKEILGVDTLLIPLCNEDCNMHGANENFDINLIKKGLEFSNLFLGKE